MSRLGEIGWDDWLAFALRFGPQLPKQACLFILILICGALLYSILNPKRRSMRNTLTTALCLTTTFWIGYFTFAAHRELTLTLLGSEDDALAEAVYQDFSKN